MLIEFLTTLVYLLLLIHLPLILYIFHFEPKHTKNFDYYTEQFLNSINNSKITIIFKSFTECISIENGITQTINIDLYEFLNRTYDNQCNLLLSNVIEYEENVEEIIDEISRVSGGNYLIHTCTSTSIYPWIHSDIINIFNKNVIDYNTNFTYIKKNKLQKTMSKYYSFILDIYKKMKI